ncbi:MAG: TIM barrel protein [Cyclobacteriaceae bacterium]
MKRRLFLRNSALAGMGLGMTGMYACSTPKKEGESKVELPEPYQPFFKLSLAQWSLHKAIFSKELSPLDFAMKAKGLGFEGLEYVNQLYANELKGGMSLEVLVKELNMRASDNGVENLIMMVDLEPGVGDMAVTDDKTRTTAIEAHYPWVDATAGLGCHSMRINMFGEFEADAWKTASVDALGRLGEYAAERKVNIIIENHGWLTSNAALLMEVINEVNMANVGTLPDFGNFCTKRKDMARWGECEEEYDMYKGIKELMPAAKAVSAKSYDFDESGNETKIDYSRMLRIVKDAGYTGFIGVEYEGDRLSEEEGIIATRDLLINAAKELA